MTNYRFTLTGSVVLATWTTDRKFAEQQDALDHARELMASFAGARNVYGVHCFRMNEDGVNGVLMGTARMKEPEAEMILPRSAK